MGRGSISSETTHQETTDDEPIIKCSRKESNSSPIQNVVSEGNANSLTNKAMSTQTPEAFGNEVDEGNANSPTHKATSTQTTEAFDTHDEEVVATIINAMPIVQTVALDDDKLEVEISNMNIGTQIDSTVQVGNAADMGMECNPLIAMLTVPEYTGETSFEEWIFKLERQFTLIPVPLAEAKKADCLAAKLGGAAQIAYKRASKSTQEDYTKLKEYLKRYFTEKHFGERSEWLGVAQGPTESVRNFADRLERMQEEDSSVLMGTEMQKAMLAQAFSKGLRKNIRKQLASACPKTWEELVDCAGSIERSQISAINKVQPSTTGMEVSSCTAAVPTSRNVDDIKEDFKDLLQGMITVK
ncbi:MAG: hypothetical protein MJA29_11605, partial [Candidatus Omnitrophica bacterium]|nr:hypothetical protein [Candidatus Omnitrophota bacterium]